MDIRDQLQLKLNRLVLQIPRLRRENPDPNNLEALYAILDDRARPYYEHRLAA